VLAEQLAFRRCPGNAEHLPARLLIGRVDVFTVHVTPPRDQAQPIGKLARRRRPAELVCSTTTTCCYSAGSQRPHRCCPLANTVQCGMSTVLARPLAVEEHRIPRGKGMGRGGRLGGLGSMVAPPAGSGKNRNNFGAFCNSIASMTYLLIICIYHSPPY